MTDEAPGLIEIAAAQLSPETLRAVVESFVLREGTDYGERAFSLQEKVTQVLRQLERGEARIVFEAHTQSVDIVLSAGRPGLHR
ncbi:MAG TPA: YheU family protein [Steroidobacteraceae bacterium]|nr:YheU family protein [Steroidobacteraceae bacterium]